MSLVVLPKRNQVPINLFPQRNEKTEKTHTTAG